MKPAPAFICLIMAAKTSGNRKKKKKHKYRINPLRLALLVLACAGGIFLIVTLIMYLQPISKAYALELPKEAFRMHVSDTEEVGYSFSEVSKSSYLLSLQKIKQGSVRFVSSDDKVVKVDRKGVLTATGEGKATVTVKVSDITKELQVETFIGGEKLSFENDSFEMNAGDEAVLKTAVVPSDAVLFDHVAYSVSDEKVLFIGQDGLLKALGPGKAVVYAKADGLTAETSVTVLQPMTGIAFNDAEEGVIRAEKGQPLPLVMRFYPEDTTDPKNVTYVLSDPDVGRIDENGVLTAKQSGKTMLTAKCNGFSSQVTLDVRAMLAGFELNHETLTLAGEKQDQLTVRLIPEDTTDEIRCAYESSDTDVIAVDENGLVTAKGPGSARVTVTVNGFKKVCSYEVIIPVTSIDLSSRTVILYNGEEKQLTASVRPDNTTEDKTVKWISDDRYVASVSEDGKIIARGSGSTSVRAVHGDIYSTCRVLVFDRSENASTADRIITFGMQYLGTTYVYGGDSLAHGIDCSSFTMQCFHHAGVSLPRVSREQAECGVEVDAGDMSKWRRGDLVFYAPDGKKISHVAIYLGGGMILHSASSQGGVVITPHNYGGNVVCRVRRMF